MNDNILKDEFLTAQQLDVTPKMANAFNDTVIHYELRGSHPAAFNTALLGVNRPVFTDNDRLRLFSIFMLEERQIENILKKLQISEQDKANPIIRESFKVINDPFNLATVWILHRCYQAKVNKKLSEKLATETMTNLLKYIQYKFFSSILYYNLRHTPDEGIMQATLDSLTAKSDIRNDDTSTWALVIKKRSLQVLELKPDSVYVDAIKNFAPDSKVLRTISGVQTALRNQMVNVLNEFYNNVRAGKKIKHTSLTQVDAEGKLQIKALQAVTDDMIGRMTGIATSAEAFIRNELLTMVCRYNSNIRVDQLLMLMQKFTVYAAQQYREGKSLLEGKYNGQTISIGYQALITDIIQTTYRTCVLDKVPLKMIPVISRADTIYHASRITDPNVLRVKNSVEYMVQLLSNSRRDTTITALKLAFIQYIVAMTMKTI